MKRLPNGYYDIGGRLYEYCRDCGKMVRIKRIFGGLHICAEQSELQRQPLNFKGTQLENRNE